MIIAYIVLAIVWIVLGILVYGMSLAYLQNTAFDPEKSYNSDYLVAILYAIYAPVTIIPVFFGTETAKYGLQFRKKKNSREKA